jgi:hypothetical protein
MLDAHLARTELSVHPRPQLGQEDPPQVLLETSKATLRPHLSAIPNSPATALSVRRASLPSRHVFA